MNYYEILGVRADATEQQIKEGYRREAMTWHPDRHEGVSAKWEADRRFKDLALAYRTLRDSAARSTYNKELGEKLRSEYEARQKKQARQESPRQDFADTGPQFDEQTASSDDANQMFSEQMLDLASELSGRGFPEFNIWKALIALGCPETLAKTVAARAAKQGFDKQAKQSTEAHDNKFEKSEFYEEFVVRPKRYLAIFAAFFGLIFASQSMNAWNASLSLWHLTFLSIWGLFGAWCFIHWTRISITNTLMVVNHQGIRFSHDGGRVKKWADIQLFASDLKEIRFSGIENGKKWKEKISKRFVSGDWQEIIFRIDQIKNRGIHSPPLSFENKRGLTSIMLWVTGAIGLIGVLAAIALPAYQDYTRRARVAEGFRIGSEAANKVSEYYNSQKKGPVDLAAAGYSLAPSNTVNDTSYNSQTGVLTVSFHDDAFKAQALLLVPTVVDRQLIWLCSSSGMPAKLLPQACKATQVAADARLALNEKEAQSFKKIKEEYARVLAVIEAKHPPLNPDSPKFDAAALEWVVTRKTFYEKGGDTEINALQFAVADYAGPR